MKTIIKILVIFTMTFSIHAQDTIERIPASMEDYQTYGPNEDEICSICLPDANYNLYTHLVDSVDYKPMNDWISSTLNGIGNFIIQNTKPVIGIGLTYGINTGNFTLSNTEYTKINKTIHATGGMGINIHAGIINGFQLVYRYGTIANSTWSHNGYSKDIWENNIEETSSSKFTAASASYGIRFEPNISNKFKPYISYSIQEVTMEWEKIGQFKYTDQTYWTYIYPNTINDNFKEKMFGTELSIGTLIPIHNWACAQILADVRYTENFSNGNSETKVQYEASSRFDFGINIQF